MKPGDSRFILFAMVPLEPAPVPFVVRYARSFPRLGSATGTTTLTDIAREAQDDDPERGKPENALLEPFFGGTYEVASGLWWLRGEPMVSGCIIETGTRTHTNLVAVETPDEDVERRWRPR